MSIENGHVRYKRHIKQEDGTYKLVSQWTSSDTVHMEDETTLENKVTDILDQVEEKAPLASPALTGTPTAPTAATATNSTQIATTAYVKNVVADLVNGAPTTMDTLKEVSDAIAAHEDVTDALNAAIGTKANASDLTSHTGNTTVHITSTERTNWNDANSKKHTHSNKTVLDNTTASYTTAEQTKLAGIAAGANAYTHPNSGVTAGTYRSVTVNAQGHVTAGSNPTTLAGYGITDAADKTHTHSNYLTGITKAMVTTALGYTPPTSDTDTHYTTGIRAGASGTNANSAATNGNVYLKVLDNTTYRGQVKIVGSGATTVTSDASGNITISSTNTTYSKATTSADGLCPKLPASDGTWKYLRSDGSWGVPTNTTYSAATQSAAGLMSAADKKKLDGIATGANAYTLPQATSLALGGVYISDAYTTTTNSSNIAFSQKGAATLYAAVAPKAHAATATTYGIGTASNYGHVKVSDNYTSSAGAAASGITASSYAVATAYSTLNTAISNVGKLTVLVNNHDVGVVDNLVTFSSNISSWKNYKGFIVVYAGTNDTYWSDVRYIPLVVAQNGGTILLNSRTYEFGFNAEAWLNFYLDEAIPRVTIKTVRLAGFNGARLAIYGVS